jgi:F5/8 type C domain
MMRAGSAPLTCLCFAGSMASAAVPPPVFVHGTSEGQGFLMTKLGQCYVVTAEHVLGGRTGADIVAPGNPAVNGEAVLVGADASRDVAVLHVSGPVTDSCGTDYTRGASQDAIARDSRAVVSIVYGEGSMQRQALNALVSQLDSEFLFLEPAAATSTALMQGLSGGLVGVNDAPAGILLGVVEHQGKVLRYDPLMKSVFHILNAMSPPRSSTTPVSSEVNWASAASGAALTRWSTPPEQPEFAISNLLRPPGQEYWRVSLGAGSVTVDIRLAGQSAQSISTVELTQGSAPSGQLVKDYEIFTSVDGTTWFYVRRGEFQGDTPVSSISFAPRFAHFVRLRVLDSFDQSTKIGALGRIWVR